MIEVNERHPYNFNVVISIPDSVWLSEVAMGFGMNKSTLLASCISKGLDYYRGVLGEIAEHEKRKHDGTPKVKHTQAEIDEANACNKLHNQGKF